MVMTKKIRKGRKQDVYHLFMFACFLFLLFFVWRSPFKDIIYSVLTLFFSLLLCFRCRKCNILFVASLFIFYCNYSVCVGVYFDPSIRPIELYSQILSPDIYSIGIFCICLFVLSLNFLITNKLIRSLNQVTQLDFRLFKSDLTFCLICFVFIALMLLGYKPKINGRGESSPLYEYNCCILILGFLCCKKKDQRKKILLFLSIIYVLLSLLNGTRIEALMVLLVCFFFYPNKRISNRLILLGVMSGILIFSIVGVFRGKIDNSTSIMNIVEQFVKNKLVFDTCVHAYFPMLCMIEQYNTIPFVNRLEYFNRFILSVIIGQSRVQNADLIEVVRNYYYHNYGGFSLGFFYVWFSFFGPFIMALFIDFIFRLGCKFGKNKGYVIPFIYLCISIPRWYLYGPWAFTRGILICLFVTFFFYIFDCFVLRKHSKKSIVYDSRI